MLKIDTEDKNENKNYEIIEDEEEEERELSNKEKADEQMEKLNKMFIIEMNLIGDKKKLIFIIKTSNKQIKNSMLVY